jgi:hypothetical protein
MHAKREEMSAETGSVTVSYVRGWDDSGREFRVLEATLTLPAMDREGLRSVLDDFLTP